MARIIVVDDEPNLLELTSESLSLEGFEVITAKSGLEALRVIRENPPDLVVCDINMPDMDGFEVLANLRGDSLTAGIPFIFLTALSEHEQIRQGMEKGADDYLTKPMDIDELLRAVNSRLVRHSHAEAGRLRDFSHRLVIAQENERHNLALSLKNNIGNKLTDLRISVEMLQRLSGNAQAITLEVTSKLLNETINTLSTLSYSLWPSLLSQLGLEAALFSLFDQMQQDGDFRIDFEYDGLDKVTKPDFTIMLYRIIQEALNNVKQHAAVNTVSVKLWIEDDRLRLHIEDKGRGFDVQSALNAEDKIGLVSMLERAFLLHGEINIISSLREGSSIYGSFPLLAKSEQKQIAQKPELQVKRFSQTPPEIAEAAKPVTSAHARIAIAEPNELSRWGYRAVIESEPRFKVVAELADWGMLLGFLAEEPIDILIISHALSVEQGGLLQLYDLHNHYPEMRILLLSNYSEYTFASQAMKNGVSAFILKTCGKEELLEALNSLVNGQQYLAKEIRDTMQSNSSANKNKSMDAFSTLTEREREIFYRVVNGQTNQEIAGELFISTRTVETHRLNMMRKLGITGTPALISFAMNKGLIGRSNSS